MEDANLTTLDEIVQKEQLKNYSLSLIVKLFGLIVLMVPFILFFAWSYLQTSPSDFPINEQFVIKSGSGLKLIAEQAKQAGLVRSKYLLLAELVHDSNTQTVKAGSYTFAEPLTTAALAEVFFAGNPSGDLIRLTHIEGETVKDFAKRASAVLPNFSSEEFINLNSNNEGLLFPDTYFVSKDFDANKFTDLLLTTFKEKTANLKEQSVGHFLTWDQIIILASILEREANSEESKKMVSGILQNRLKLGMALQADATIEYALDKSLASLTPTDLELDTPYNTYLYTGLPPTAIGNPGLKAIEAVIHPTESEYYFYITGHDGNFYYAKNFDQHRANIARYLR